MLTTLVGSLLTACIQRVVNKIPSTMKQYKNVGRETGPEAVTRQRPDPNRTGTQASPVLASAGHKAPFIR